MNKSLSLLRIEADTSCKFRGHKMSWNVPSKYNNSKRECQPARCEYCDMEVFIDTKPAPNSIDISGEAVALNCPES